MNPSPERPSPARNAVVIGGYLALVLLVFAAYRGTLGQSFIADDFAHLHFLRGMRAPLLRYLDPTFSYSDPVTEARYLPIKLYCLLFFQRTFDLDAAPYHAASIALHALSALLVGHLATKVFDDRIVGVVAALLFATTPLNAQNVCWMVCIPNLLGALLLLFAVAISLRPQAGIGAALGVTSLLWMSFLCRSDTASALAFLVPLWLYEAKVKGRRVAWQFIAGALVAGGVTAVLGAVNLRYFPEPGMRLGLAPQRFFAFLLDLWTPFSIPLIVRVALVAGVLFAAVKERDRRIGYMLYGIALGGATWTVVVYLRLTPRYFYAFSALSSMILAALLVRSARRLMPSRGDVAALALTSLIAVFGARTIARDEVVWFDYLSGPGRALIALKQERRAEGAKEPLRVAMTPHLLLTYPDTAFFRPELAIVRDGSAAVTVDTQAPWFVRYYGEDFGNAFWRHPWLLE